MKTLSLVRVPVSYINSEFIFVSFKRLFLVCLSLSAYFKACIIINSDKIREIFIAVNIHQTFEGYKTSLPG